MEEGANEKTEGEDDEGGDARNGKRKMKRG